MDVRLSSRGGALAAVAVAVVAGCSLQIAAESPFGTIDSAGRSISYVGPAVQGGPAEGPITRMFLGTCIGARLEGEESATLTALAPIALGFAVDTLGRVLQRAGAERAVAVYAARRWPMEKVSEPPRKTSDATPAAGPAAAPLANATPNAAQPAVAVNAAATSAAGGGTIDTSEREQRPDRLETPRTTSFDCVQFVHGAFVGDPAEAASPDWLQQSLRRRELSPGALRDDLTTRGILLAGEPAFFLEAQVMPGPDGGHALRPLLLHYARSIDTGATGVSRGLFVEFGMNHPPLSMSAKDASRGVLAIGQMTAGGAPIEFGHPDPRTPEMLWLAPPGGQPAAGEFRNVEMRLVEVRDARPILASLGDLLVGPAGDALAGALRQDLFPTEAERSQEVTDRIAALGALQSALANYEAALTARDAALAQARSAGPAALALATARQDAAVEAAKLAVQLAARRAGRPSPL